MTLLQDTPDICSSQCQQALPETSLLFCCRETVRKTVRLHQWDVLRANKAPFAFGLEPRVPFLDKTFLELVMNIDPQEKMVRGAAPLIWKPWPL